jgi:hypothetical protein
MLPLIADVAQLRNKPEVIHAREGRLAANFGTCYLPKSRSRVQLIMLRPPVHASADHGGARIALM